MKHGDINRKNTLGIFYLALFIGLSLLVGTVAADDSMPTYTNLAKIGEGGFGDPQNNYAWSVAEFNGDIYVGTGRNIPYFVAQGMKALGVFPENWTLSFLTTPAGSPPPPLVLPNQSLPSQEEVINWSNDMRGEIWRYHEGSWSRVHQASTFVNPLNGYTYPEGIGYRAMTTFNNSEGQEALYAGVGFGFGPILIVTSTDGTTWMPVDTGSIPSRDTRAMISHNGKLYVGTGEGIYASASPSPYTDNWEKVANFQTASLASHNGYLYAGTGNPIGPSETDGFEVWRSTIGSPSNASDWVRVVSGGAGDEWNVLAGTICEYEDDLYVGSMNLPFGTGTEGVKGFDLIRVYDNDSWDLIVGNYQPKIPSDPRGPPLSGWPSGYTNPFNLYAWSIEEYNGNLYLGSFDIFSLARFIDEIPGANEILLSAIASMESADQGNMPEEFADRLEEFAQMYPESGEGSYIIPVISLLANNFGGGDLWTSPDGLHWYPVDLNGLGDPDNYGIRTMMTTPEGILIGTANPFSGCQVWIGSTPECPPDKITGLHNTTYQPDRITWNWTDPSSENFSHVIVYLDGEFMENVPKGVQSFTASGLDPDCEYTIEARTVSTDGLVNKKWVCDTARTAPAANLMIGKSAPAFHENATEMNYTLFYRNQGTGTAADVVLTEYLPPSVEFVSGTNYPVYDDTERTVTWYLGSLISGATGNQSLTVHIPSSVSYGTVLTNTANITTITPESRYDDNTASVNTTVRKLGLPPGVSVSPSVPGPWGEICVDWRDTVTFSYNQTICPPETPVSILIHIDDGGPDITAPMTGGPQYWSYTTSFYPRYGSARVTYETPGCIISGITFNLKVDPAGYVYDTVSGNRIAGAEVMLQWPDEEGNWVNVPTGLCSPPMEPDQNPLTTNASGQFQWDVEEGSYRVYADTDGYAPAASTMVNSPPQFSDLAIGLDPTTGNIWVSSTPTGADIYLDGSDTGFVTPHELAGVSAGQHELVLRLAGYQNYNATVTVTAGHTVTMRGTLIPLPPNADFSANTTSGEAPLPVRFTDNSTGKEIIGRFWSFGDGQTSNETDPVHVYAITGNFTVSLQVTNAEGSDTATRTDYIHVIQSLPVPDFEGSPVSGDAPLDVMFSDTSTGTVTSRWWDFGDGTTVWENATPSISHTYPIPATYTVSLTAGNSAGQATVTKSEYIQVDPSGIPPDARFTATSRLGTVPMTVGLTDHSTMSPVKWQWDFGDGSTSSEQNPQHTYNAAGRFRVTLTAFNSGGSDSYSSYVWVIQGSIIPTPTTTPTPTFTPIPERAPVAFFAMDKTFGIAPLIIQFTDQSIYSPTSRLWEFGDGQTSTLQNPVHTFTEQGRYTIRLTVQNPIGESTTTRRLYVY
jgi:uncharacterized repeat protein (TIGR01451 family)